MSDNDVPVVPFVNADAPYVFTDGASSFGFYNGIGHVTLEAMRFTDDNAGGVRAEKVAVAHLRMNLPAAQSLHDTLSKLLLMAARPEGQAN